MRHKSGIKERGRYYMNLPPLQPCLNTLSPNKSRRAPSLLGWAGAFLVILGYYFNAHEVAACWLIWIVGNSLIGVYSWKNEAYPTAAMSFILVAMNVYGYINWIT